ncbi:MAG TPA: ParB/RepB/Spo0J family partition protein [Streptosporangiaceae bacterium]|nr:ParB/RepB/Spo0J family partition protein [Streptosporangiaceae bacterium]
MVDIEAGAAVNLAGQLLAGEADRAISEVVSDPMTGLEHVPETDVALRSLVPGFYLRQAGTDATHIRLLADAAGSVRLPPILVQRNGWRIIDGMHRVAAAKLRGEQTIRALVIDCTDAQALVLAIKSNVLHGLPLSKAERISGAKRILAAHQDWSDRAVAEVAGLSAKTIASLRNRSTSKAQFQGKRLGRDGKRRPLSAADGRRRAAEYIGAHPEASLREVAREADVSLGTVHDVRSRIRRGSDPVSSGHGCHAVQPGTAVKPAPGSGQVVPANPRALPATSLCARADRNAQRLGWPAISAKLASDPALKYTDGGRAFLRWMATHSAQAEDWREFIDAVPAHWVRDVSRIADIVSAEWQEFADRLRNRQQAAV